MLLIRLIASHTITNLSLNGVCGVFRKGSCTGSWKDWQSGSSEDFFFYCGYSENLMSGKKGRLRFRTNCGESALFYILHFLRCTCQETAALTLWPFVDNLASFSDAAIGRTRIVDTHYPIIRLQPVAWPKMKCCGPGRSKRTVAQRTLNLNFWSTARKPNDTAKS